MVYKTFQWKIYTTPHFDLYYYPEEEPALSRVASMAESAYETLSKKFNFKITKKIPLIFYRTHAEFEQTNVLLNFIPEGVGAFAEPVRNRMVLPIDLPDQRLQKLILHELTHIFEFEFFFQGKVGKNLINQPPQWFMEGLASFMAKDEDAFARMILRDAVFNDHIPSITQEGVYGYFAYRFGHALFDFIENRWGEEGLRFFFYEFRTNVGRSVEKAVKRSFQMPSDELDRKFRMYLRKKYLPLLVNKGEPQEYGKPFIVNLKERAHALSPVLFPSSDLVAAVSTYQGDVDVVLYDIRGKEILVNMTPGLINKYEYMVATFLEVGPDMGRDIALSPDGNIIAFIGRKGRGRILFLLDLLKRKYVKTFSFPQWDKERAPVFSPDGKSIVFQAWRKNQQDLVKVDIETGKTTVLTDDPYYDGAACFSPDGKTLVYSSETKEGMNLFALNTPTGEIKQLTFSEGNHIDATFDPSGKWLYYAWDREDAYNIYRMELATGKVEQLTNVATGCFQPAVGTTLEGKPLLLFTSYYNNRFNIYRAEDPPTLQTFEEKGEPQVRRAKPFTPIIEVPMIEENKKGEPKFSLKFEDGGVEVGVNTDQTIVSHSYLRFSDILGNSHLVVNLESISTYSDSQVTYFDLGHRTQWGLSAYDRRSYFITYDYLLSGGRFGRRERALRYTGAFGFLQYPFSLYHRLELGGGWESRSINYPVIFQDDLGNIRTTTIKYKDNYPYLFASFHGDTTLYRSFGPLAGRRYALSYYLAPSLQEPPKTYLLDLDFRQYLPLSRRSLIAWRLYGATSGGQIPYILSFGGLDTLRGYDFREFYGDTVAFTNIELRFPLIDSLRFPFMEFRQIRGRIFCDIGAGWFKDEPFRFVRDNRLDQGKASIGIGFTVRFIGLDWNWDFARRWDFKNLQKEVRTSFWIGRSF